MLNLELLYKPAQSIAASWTVDWSSSLIVCWPSSSDACAAGGLAVALEAALRLRGGLWFGWSGKTSEECDPALQYKATGTLTYAVCDLSRRDIEQYYCGFANRVLWSICHYRLDLANLPFEGDLVFVISMLFEH